MTNARNTVLYVGVTNDLKRRAYEHRNGLLKGFTKRYNVHKLVYYEAGEDVSGAIEREKQIKGGSRADKITLVNSMNPDWRDLYDDI
jgi:putative endonuclease